MLNWGWMYGFFRAGRRWDIEWEGSEICRGWGYGGVGVVPLLVRRF